MQIFSGYENFTNEELNGKLFDIENSIAHLDLYIYEEEEKYKRYKVCFFIKNFFVRLRMKEDNIIIVR